jgi:hypothetical protein
VAAGALLGRTGGFLTLVDAASRVRVVLAAMPGVLYRISTPAGSGLAPHVTAHAGRVRAALRPTGGDGPDEVLIVLNRDVRWAIDLPAGAGEQQLDLRRGRLARVDLGASGLVELRLPRPAGEVPVTLSGAVGSVALSGDPAVPLRLELAAGAAVADTPWGVGVGAGPGTVLQTPGWITTRHRYAIRARSAIGTLTVRRAAPPPGRRS